MSGRRWTADGSLPAPLPVPILEGRFADLLLRPWFDRIALRAVVDWYFPLSRAWAAAIEARGSPARFAAEGGVPIVTRRRTQAVLAMVEARRRALAAADERWIATFFGNESAAPAAALAASQIGRVEAAHALMSGRAAFLPARWRQPAVRWSVAPPARVEERHGRRLSGEEPPFPMPRDVAIMESRRVANAVARQYWLRFPSSVAGAADTAWAHVYEPAARKAHATLIFLHGLALETEMWRAVADPVNALVARGIRVVRPEGPWHGRRRATGFYGGEPVFASGALGFIDLFEAWVSEIAVLTRWARRSGAGAVAIGGLSLGALAAQLAATAARDWRDDARPDALFLVATSGDVATAAVRGGMAQGLGVLPRLAGAGWRDGDFARWRSLIEPIGEPVVAPDRIVMVLGKADRVTPFEGGQTLATNWRVPSENLFMRRQGHFSAALGLYRHPEPLARLAALL